MSKILNVITCKCPNCGEGRMFPAKNPYKISGMLTMNKRCPVCDNNLEPEPQFYMGAMYISYAFNVLLVAVLFIIAANQEEMEAGPFVWMALLASVVIAPLNFRVSRSIWLYVFSKK